MNNPNDQQLPSDPPHPYPTPKDNPSEHPYKTPENPSGQGDHEKFDFPNDWIKKYSAKIEKKNIEWKATAPVPRYYTSHHQQYKCYPDRKGIPQICKSGEIDDIIGGACEFLVKYSERTATELRPSDITLFFSQKISKSAKSKKPQIRLHYSWSDFFKILWLNANDETGLGIEIPPKGYRYSAVEKFESSLRRNVAPALAIALENRYISDIQHNKLSLEFKKLSKDFGQEKKDNQEKKENQKKKQDPHQEDDDKEDEQQEAQGADELTKNASEAMNILTDGGFTLSDHEPEFTREIQTKELSDKNLVKIMPQELKRGVVVAKKLSAHINGYKYRIKAVLDAKSPYVSIIPYPESNNKSAFEIYTELKEIFGKDAKEGQQDPQVEFSAAYFKKMLKVYEHWKNKSLELFDNEEKEWDAAKEQLKELKDKFKNGEENVYVFREEDNKDNDKGDEDKKGKVKVQIRGKLYESWMQCCTEYNYPGRDILDYLDNDKEAADGGD